MQDTMRAKSATLRRLHCVIRTGTDISDRVLMQGWVDKESGQAELTFDALFTFTAGPIYKPPSLEVKTVLSTESAQGTFQSADGARFQCDGSSSRGRLVGIAKVPQTGDWLLDAFLQLPSEAFALLTAELEGL